jgi:Ca2+-binding RTX toxin-like protein
VTIDLDVTAYAAGIRTVDISLADSGNNGSNIIDISEFVGTDATTLTGADGTGSQAITGGAGVDTITGGGGVDTIIGGGAADVLVGNAGNDIFKYLATSVAALATEVGSAVGSGQTGETITFVSGGDKLHFDSRLVNNGSDSDTLKVINKAGTVADNDTFVHIADTASGDSVHTLAGAVVVLNGLTTTAVATGEDVIFAMDNDTNTYLYMVAQLSSADTIAAQDVTFIGTLSGITTVTNGDFVSF